LRRSGKWAPVYFKVLALLELIGLITNVLALERRLPPLSLRSRSFPGHVIQMLHSNLNDDEPNCTVAVSPGALDDSGHHTSIIAFATSLSQFNVKCRMLAWSESGDACMGGKIRQDKPPKIANTSRVNVPRIWHGAGGDAHARRSVSPPHRSDWPCRWPSARCPDRGCCCERERCALCRAIGLRLQAQSLGHWTC